MAGSDHMMLYEANKKQVLVAYLFWFFLGVFGAHRFYIGKNGSAAAIPLLFLTSIVLLPPLTIIPVIWVLVDAILIPGMVQRSNNELALRIKSET